MLIIWSSADAKVLREVIGEQVARSSVQHVVVSDMSNLPPSSSGDITLAMGTKALTTLIAMGLVPKNRTVGSLRGRPFTIGGATLYLTYDPGVVARDYARKVDIQWDVQLAARVLLTGSPVPKFGDYRYVESYHELVSKVDQQFEKTGVPVEVSCDLETVGLDEYAEGAYIVTISFSIEDGKSDVMYFDKREKPLAPLPWESGDDLPYWSGVWVQIEWLLTSPQVSIRGANFKFDSRWINHHWKIDCTNQKFDTLLVGSLLDENRSNSLKLHAKIYTNMGGYEDGIEKYDKGRMDLIPKQDILLYTGADTDVTLQVAKKMKAEILKDKALTNFYVKLLQPASKAFERLERTGIVVDVPYYERLRVELRTELTRLETGMVGMLPNKLRIKYRDSIQEAIDAGKSPLKATIMKEFLFSKSGLGLKPKMTTPKTGEPSITSDHLMMFADVPEVAEFLKLYKEHTSASKTLSTYVVGFLKHLRSDGRFHPTFLLGKQDYGDDEDTGTNTGRTSAKDPAVQCQRGSSLICCEGGNHTLESIVLGFESGRSYLVKSHTGAWRRVVGVYRNGVKPVFEVATRSGLVTGCTENHPLLLAEGFVRTDATRVGDLVFVDGNWHGTEDKKSPIGAEVFKTSGGWKRKRTQRALALSLRLRDGKVCGESGVKGGASEVLRVLEEGSANLSRSRKERRISNLYLLDRNASQSAGNNRSAGGLETLRGRYRRSKMGGLREFPSGYGREATGHHVGSKGELQGVLSRQLSMGNSVTASQKSNQQRDAYIQWADAMRSRMGRDYRAGDELVLPTSSRLDRGRGFVDSQRAAQAGFVLDPIVSIKYIGDEETFDLTVEEDHSFVADGFVVHNTIPKHTVWTKRLRRAFTCPTGYVILQLDYSQGELRIAACVANEPTMIQAYRDGLDLHSITAARLNGYEMGEFMLLPEDLRDELRSGGKAGNFGLLYGMQHRGYKDYAYYSYGVSMTEEEAFKQREAFFSLYSRLPEWHDEYKAFARRNGFIRSPLGRVRHLPQINSRDSDISSKQERQSINAPIQSCLSDMMQLAMVVIDRELGDSGVQPFLMTHDSLAMYVPEDDAIQRAKEVKEIMENLPLSRDFGWNPPLVFLADAEMSAPGEDGVHSLATLKKLKNL